MAPKDAAAVETTTHLVQLEKSHHQHEEHFTRINQQFTDLHGGLMRMEIKHTVAVNQLTETMAAISESLQGLSVKIDVLGKEVSQIKMPVPPDPQLLINTPGKLNPAVVCEEIVAGDYILNTTCAAKGEEHISFYHNQDISDAREVAVSQCRDNVSCNVGEESVRASPGPIRTSNRKWALNVIKEPKEHPPDVSTLLEFCLHSWSPTLLHNKMYKAGHFRVHWKPGKRALQIAKLCVHSNNNAMKSCQPLPCSLEFCQPYGNTNSRVHQQFIYPPSGSPTTFKLLLMDMRPQQISSRQTSLRSHLFFCCIIDHIANRMAQSLVQGLLCVDDNGALFVVDFAIYCINLIYFGSIQGTRSQLCGGIFATCNVISAVTLGNAEARDGELPTNGEWFKYVVFLRVNEVYVWHSCTPKCLSLWTDLFVIAVDDHVPLWVCSPVLVAGLMNSTSGGISKLVVAATAHLRVDYHIIAQATLSSVDGLHTAAFRTPLYYMFNRSLGMLFVRMRHLYYITEVDVRLFDPGIGHTECLLVWPFDLPVKVAYNRMVVRVLLLGTDHIRDSDIANMTKYMDNQFLRSHQLASAESVTPWSCSTKIVRISCIVPYLLEHQYYDCCVLSRTLELATYYSDEHSAVLPEISATIPFDKEQKTSAPSAYNLCFHSCIVYLLRNNPGIVGYMFPASLTGWSLLANLMENTAVGTSVTFLLQPKDCHQTHLGIKFLGITTTTWLWQALGSAS